MRSFLLLTLATSTLACAALVGCGQTGNLYLPDKDAEVVPSTSDPAVDAAIAAAAAEAERKRNEVSQPTPPAPQ